MRVVLDTNVVVSGVLSEAGPPGWILDLVMAGELAPVFDGRIFSEYREVLYRPQLKSPRDKIDTFLDVLEEIGLHVTVRPWPYTLPDPSDEPFLAVAGAAQAVLITGNGKHFPPELRAGVTVLSPREFLDYIRRK